MGWVGMGWVGMGWAGMGLDGELLMEGVIDIVY